MPNAGRNFDYSIRRPNVYIPSNPRRFNRRYLCQQKTASTQAQEAVS